MHLAVGLLACVLSTGARPPSEGIEEFQLRFAAEPGSSLSKAVVAQHELSLDEMGSTRDGGPLMREDVGGWMSANTRTAFVDEYLAVAEGRPEVFRRTFKASGGSAKMTMTGSRSVAAEARHSSDFAGFGVVHTWIPEEGTWGRCFDYLVSEEAQLEELQDDADFLGFLPGGPVAVGDTWSIEPTAMRSLFAPGGNTGSVPTENGFFPRMVEVGLGGDLADVLGRELFGAASATLHEVREEEGARLAVIRGEYSLHSERDRTRTYIEGMPKEERREVANLQGVMLTWTADGTFELLWDLDAGHSAGATAGAQETVTAEIFKRATVEGGARLDVSQRTTYSGRLEVEFKVRPAREQELAELGSDARTAAEPENPRKPERKGHKKR